MNFTPSETQRYSRHFILPGFGKSGQSKLKQAKVLIIGAGGLGSPASLYLAAAGVGRIGIVDDDQVSLSNLQRQILHAQSKVGMGKIDSALERLRDLNPDVEIIGHALRLDASNARALFSQYDVIVDASDNYVTRYLVNDACVLEKKILVSASVFRFEGQISVFCRENGPCYRCLYPEAPASGTVPSCEEGGVLGVVPGILGCLQASEAIKVITGSGEALFEKIFTIDVLSMRTRSLKFRRDPNCAACGDHPTIFALKEISQSCALPEKDDEAEISPLAVRDSIRTGEILLVDVRTDEERSLNRIEPSLHIPVDELSERMSDIPTDRKILFYCKAGSRSLRAVKLAEKSGITGSLSLAGGILRWIEEIDPQLPSY